MQAVKLTDKVWWVGAIDWGLRDFHGYATSRGSTYNAYLILADKVALVDTVKAPFKNEMMTRIASVIDPEKIDYIISNHSEMDHTGCLPEVIDAVKPEKVFASKKGVEAIKAHFHFDAEITPIEDEHDLSLGNMKITFYETRMLHWPDSMFSFLHEEGILFSQDGFGMHLASSERFDDELDEYLLRHETSKYYANILTPYSGLIAKLIEKLGKLNLPIKMVAPDHGPVWRKNISKVVDWYTKWSKQEPTKRAVIIYDTMWQSTARMAGTIADGIASVGAFAKVMPLHGSHRSDVATELLEAGAVVVGSPTINNQMFPTVADVLTYIKGLKFKNLIGAAFGSYGWSGESVKLVESQLAEMKVEVVADSISTMYVPRHEDLEKCFSMGKIIGEKLAK